MRQALDRGSFDVRDHLLMVKVPTVSLANEMRSRREARAGGWRLDNWVRSQCLAVGREELIA